jgi:hypothetical protein
MKVWANSQKKTSLLLMRLFLISSITHPEKSPR